MAKLSETTKKRKLAAKIAEDRIRIAARTKSRTLDLSQLGLTKLPPTIGKLTSLRRLSCYSNKLESLPAELANLKKLSDLNLGYNQFKQLPQSIGSLTALKELNLVQNKLSDLPTGFGRLQKLQVLYLTNNDFKAVPKCIGQLSALQHLALGYNRLRIIPDFLMDLAKLRILVLESNDLAVLPASLLRFPKDGELFVAGNKRLRLPPELVRPHADELPQEQLSSPRTGDILTFYFERNRAARPLNETKLVLVGRGTAGKTSIKDRLLYDTFDPNKPETKGIAIDHWSLRCSSELMQVHVWDFAGQEIAHATHQFFLTEQSVYLIVLDARADTQDRDAEYWLRLVSAFGKDSPILIALNKWDEKAFDVDRFALREKYPAIREFIATDCETRLGIDELNAAISRTIAKMETVHQPFPAVWITLKDHFSAMKENYLPFSEFRCECRRLGEDNAERQERLARILHALGIILHYADDPRLRDATVLNPRWVTESIYRLLSVKAQPGSDGTLTLADARNALPDESPTMVAYLIDLMRRFDLCFPIDDAAETWLVPELLPRFQPKLTAEWLVQDSLRLRYKYKVLPEGLVPRFITRTYPLSIGQLRWRNGVVLEMDGARALVRNDASAAEIGVVITGKENARRRLAKIVRTHFSHIHADFHGLEPQELLEVEGHTGVFKSVKVLEQDEQNKVVTTVDTPKGSVEIDQKSELDRISALAARQSTTRRLKLFLSYSHQDTGLRDLFRFNLDLLEADGLIDWWFDGKILPSAEWDKAIRRELNEADIVVCLLSTPFLSSKYVREVEMPRTLERRAEGEVEIVSVPLEDCAWHDREFTKYQMVLPGGIAVAQWPRPRDAFNEVEKTLRKLIQARLRKAGEPDVR